MAEDKATFELQKLEREVKKLDRDLGFHIEKERFGLEKIRINADQDRVGKEHVRSVISLFLTAISVLATVAGGYFTIKKNQEITANADRQKTVERVDKLKSEYYNDEPILERRADIAFQLMSIGDTTIISNYDLKKFTDIYRAFFAEISKRQNTVDVYQKKVDKEVKNLKPSDIPKLDAAEKKQIELENKLRTLKNSFERAEIVRDLSDLSEKTPAVKSLNELSAKQVELNSYKQSSSDINSEVTWFKEHYYRPYDGFIVTLSDLRPNRTGTVEIREKIGNGFSNPIHTIGFTVPGKKNFDVKGIAYEIDFLKIDRAGKNPLTKAVYFSIRKL